MPVLQAILRSSVNRSLRMHCLALVLAGCALPSGRIGAQAPAEAAPAGGCLPAGNGFFAARLQGTLEAELDWGNAGTECTGAMRPDGGIRLGFSRAIYAGDERLVVLIGIAALREGQSARALPVNVTVIRQGTGQFFSTRGDDKCMVDELRQEPLAGIPHRERTWRVTGRGFCTQPARSLDGTSAVFIPRFDFAGRVDFSALADPVGAGADESATPATDRR